MKKIILIIVILSFSLIYADKITLNDSNNNFNVIRSDESETIVDYNISTFNKNDVDINGERYQSIYFDMGANTIEKGEPSLPKISKSIIVNNYSKPEIKILSQEFIELDMNIVPSKGIINRNINPDSVPFTFSKLYKENTFFPANITYLGEPYIMRDYRGVVINVQPFQFNPVTKKLRVYTNIKISVTQEQNSSRNILTSNRKENVFFSDIYKKHFINYPQVRYDQVEEIGRMIVIADDQFSETIQPYIKWKNQKGILTNLYLKSEVGNNYNAIKTFIQNQYEQNDGLVFVQLVGDAEQLPPYINSGIAKDPMYSLLAGSDNYPEIFIGRFSAENSSQLETQVQRTIYYERDLNSGDWMQKGVGIASSEGGGSGSDNGEIDWEHMDIIRDKLLEYGYLQIDRIYDNNGANPQMVANAINEGRGTINYVGHGSTTSWATSDFSNSHINALTNDNMLPFINSVACVNGNFQGGTCFAEAWMRATNNQTGNPTGAIAIYASSVNQSWAPPMCSQDHFIDLLVTDAKNTTGGLYYNASCHMLDQYSSSDDMFNTWHIFGDVSLQVRTKEPTPIIITELSPLIIGTSEYAINTNTPNALVSLSNSSDEIISKGYTDNNGSVTLTFEPITQNIDLKLTITGYNKITNTQELQAISIDGAYVSISGVVPQTNIVNGSNVDISFELLNCGTEDTGEVYVTIYTENPYVSINLTRENVGIITPGQRIIIDDLALTVSENIPNNENIVFNIIARDGTETWESHSTLSASAPELKINEIRVEDSNNNMLDPNETVEIIAKIKNLGKNSISEFNLSLETNNDNISINNTPITINSLAINGEIEVSFQVQIGDVPQKSLVNFLLFAQAGNYSTAKEISLPVASVEGFETGNLLANNWENGSPGNSGWVINNNIHHSGNYSLKSSNISNNQVASISLTVNNLYNSDISFFRKVSSETNYDKLRFFINNEEMDSWSGELNWEQVSYSLPEGESTLKWSYSKDVSSSTGQDCAWIDDILLPTTSNIQYNNLIVDQNTIEFGNHSTPISKFLTLINPTESDISGNITIPYRFKVNYTETTLDYIIEAGKSITYDILFEPFMDEEFSENLTFNYGSNQLVVELKATSVSVADNINSVKTILEQNYPNPFNPKTRISFSLSKSENVSITIYNIKGQRVKNLINSNLDKGEHHIMWHGTNDQNRQVGSGIYFYRMTSGKYTSTKKMILLK